MSPPIKKRALPIARPGIDFELLCSRFVSNVLRCWSVSFLLPDGAWTLITSTVTPPGPQHRNVCAVRGSPSRMRWHEPGPNEPGLNEPLPNGPGPNNVPMGHSLMAPRVQGSKGSNGSMVQYLPNVRQLHWLRICSSVYVSTGLPE